MKPRLEAAVFAANAAARASRVLGRGGGTALPGLVAEHVDPGVIPSLARRYEAGATLITGTNGKTTASRILASILDAARRPYLHNREGSNMMRGIASTLVTRPRPAAGSTLLLEVDEATMPAAARATAPRAMVFTNLFRDQLDRYGEVDTVAAMWREALAAAPDSATLVLNADDPSVAELALDWLGPVHWFGLDDAAFATEAAGAFDARWCRRCGTSFTYERRYFAHVGLWQCAGCPRERATPDTSATEVRLELDRARFAVPGLGECEMPLSGVYNVYNALAAIGLARTLGIAPESIIAGVAGVRAAFGRQETVTFEGRELRLLLAKNPAGANEVLRLLEVVAAQQHQPLRVAVLLNDRFADGQDVSWIWDVDWERLSGVVERPLAGGTRAADMALRLLYAGWPDAETVEDGPGVLLDTLLRITRPGERVFVVHTYTAMLDLREELVRRGAVAAFWKG
jgi:UDP-N-acetylmuramyl tripeptide synthase